jgi:hypothetical protein
MSAMTYLARVDAQLDPRPSHLQRLVQSVRPSIPPRTSCWCHSGRNTSTAGIDRVTRTLGPLEATASRRS